jgi:hypothetical protein
MPSADPKQEKITMTPRFLLILIATTQLPALMANNYSAVLDRSTYVVLGGSVSINAFEASSVPAFTADFGADKTLQITYSAPAGYRFHVDAPPAGLLVPLLSIDLIIPETGPYFSQEAGTVTFGGGTGDLPSMPAPTFSQGSGDLDIYSNRIVSGDFTFSSVTLTIPVDAGYNAGFLAVQPLTALIRVQGVFGSPVTDPGQWAFLEADRGTVPEPRSTSLFLCGLSLIALGRRRKRRVKA